MFHFIFQMSPEVYSDFTRQQGFHTSLLERLHELYPKECVYMVSTWTIVKLNKA